MSAPSILQTEKVCYITGATQGLDKHHIYGGNPNRKISDQNGFWVWLRHDVHMAAHEHRQPHDSLLFDLRIDCQRTYEAMGHTREEFRRLIGRSYL